MRHSRLFAVAVPLALALAVPPGAQARAVQPEQLKRVGATALVYRGPAIELAMSTRFARANRGAPWLFLDVAMTASSRPVEIRRDAVAVLLPDGQTVPLASQEKFAIAFPDLVAPIARANVAAEPLGYLTARRPRRLDLFSAPGRHIVFPSVWLDEWHTTYGRLYFDVPGKVQPGTYALLINLPAGAVKIPFEI
jgi:hypothetical protein